MTELRSSPGQPTMAQVILLLAPAYDDFTVEMCGWLLEASTYPSKARVLYLAGASVSRKQIEHLLTESQANAVLAVFCGHGVESALLGAPSGNDDDLTVNGLKHSKIYCEEHAKCGPRNLFCFCCKAALKLGRSFDEMDGHHFLGFAGDLPLDLSNGECKNTWKSIVQKAVLRMINDISVSPAHETFLRQSYSDAYSYYANGIGRKNDRALLMRAYLIRHSKLLRLHGSK